MLTIRVEFLHGVLRAGSPDDIAMTGLADPGEWPPSPGRLFSALVAAAGTGSRCVIGDCSELELLESAHPPEVLVDPDEDVLRTRVHSRFVVIDERYVQPKTRETQSVHEYVARTSAEVRPGTRMAPRVPEVTYLWPDVSLSPDQFASIESRAARVGYLGCSDSPVRLSVSGEAPPDAAERRWTPEVSGMHSTPVPYPGFTRALDTAFEQWLKGPVRRAWLPTRRAGYAAPGHRPSGPTAQPTALWFQLHPPVSGRFALALTETLRDATLDLYDRSAPDEVPAVLHGHGFSGSGRNHAYFLALPDVGFRHSSGRIHGCALWLPPDTDAKTIANLRAALGKLNELVRPGWFKTVVRFHGGEPRPLAASPSRWAGPSRRWVSALPVVHERWSPRGPDHDEIERWFEHAGHHCRVLEYRTSLAPLLPGSVRLRPGQVHHKGMSRRPYSFLEVELDREIRGPVAIGGARQFGMGLMAPQG